MTIHLGQSFALAIIALLLVLAIASLANKIEGERGRVRATVKYALLVLLFAMCWMGVFQVVRWIAARF